MVLVTLDTARHGCSISLDTALEKKSAKKVWEYDGHKTIKSKSVRFQIGAKTRSIGSCYRVFCHCFG